MQKPKVVIIGAGSLFFGRQAIWQMVHSPHLNNGTIALVDKNRAVVARMKRLAEKVAEHAGVRLKIEASTERKEVLKDADFVVLSFAEQSVKYRSIDCKIAAKYGIRMCSGDTIGPGGIMRTLREFPHIMACCEDIRALCPDAWVINYINPAATNGIGMQKLAPDLKSFALCDGLHMPMVKRFYAYRAGLIDSEDTVLSQEMDEAFDFRIAGPNHFTWLLKAEYKGKDYSKQIAEFLKQKAATETTGRDTGAKSLFNNTITYQLYEIFGYVPTCTGHSKEYVRFWQGLGKLEEKVPPLSLWDRDLRYKRHADMWDEVDEFVLGVRPISEFKDYSGPDHATDIIETMWGGLKKPFFINTPNKGAVTNCPDDAFLEMLCDVDMDGPRPRPVGEAPVGLRGLWQQILDSHELTSLAAMNGDRDLLRRAFLCDPLVSSIADTDAMIDELLTAEREALPPFWFS